MGNGGEKQRESPAYLENKMQSLGCIAGDSAIEQRHHDVCAGKIPLRQLSLSSLRLIQ